MERKLTGMQESEKECARMLCKNVRLRSLLNELELFAKKKLDRLIDWAIPIWRWEIHLREVVWEQLSERKEN